MSEFRRLTGISKTRFYEEYRWSARWQRELDLRLDPRSNRLTASREKAIGLVSRLSGSRAVERSPLADRLGGHSRRIEAD